MKKLSAELSKFLTKVMTMGAGTALPIVMSPTELAKLIGVVYSDNNLGHLIAQRSSSLWDAIAPPENYYYDIDTTWFDQGVELSGNMHVELMLFGIDDIPDFKTYLHCLSELHKRRKKYSKILSAQPLPEMIQISPRALIEFGTVEHQALASWLTWRKFFYDLDNRAAQETGYLFEPILSYALGGEQVSARGKAVVRQNDPTKGRQVDCWKVLPDGRKLAYEFKLRVTIAASGQGRFGEEIQFAIDARLSGATPILLVLDPTMNHRLDDLQKAYQENGGVVYLGDAAWEHLEEESGVIMSNFIDRYVHSPIQCISRYEKNSLGTLDLSRNNLLDFNASNKNGSLIFKFGEIEKIIHRHEDGNIVNNDDE
ncbi:MULTISPECIES: hypothetical protein [unclassified Serratia (in: enterobacteria)]|uniref:hypothetical protein n=1 Tax=unclassified Serratia (in: enterobacteria) TaxID=2647522 RepID=UPI0021179CCA|nr:MULTISPECIES: hypothetical protein [unclassified Serratia (in: enterobacteria)]